MRAFGATTGGRTMNKVDFLLVHPFALLSEQDQLKTVKLGPDHSDIFIMQASFNQTRYFNMRWFDRKPWLTASENKKALFCFNCLIFGGDVAWTKTGIKDLKHLSERIKHHEKSTFHQLNCSKIESYNDTVSQNDEQMKMEIFQPEIVIKEEDISCDKFDDVNEGVAEHAAETQAEDGPHPGKCNNNEEPPLAGMKAHEIVDAELAEIAKRVKRHFQMKEPDEPPSKRFHHNYYCGKPNDHNNNNNNNNNNLFRMDATELLFHSYARMLKGFPKKKQIDIKIKIHDIFVMAELEEIEQNE